MVYWFTGQPSHGKTVLANMFKESHLPTSYRIDGDEMRELFTNVDAAQKISHYLHNQGMNVIVSLVSPYIDQREEFKKLLGDDLVEIYIHTSEPRERDHFKSEAYVAPKENFIDIDTTVDTPEESLQKIISKLGW